VTIEQCRAVGPCSKEEGVSEIHLACIAGKQIPARSKYGKDAGQSEDAEEIGVLSQQGQEKQKDKKKHGNDPRRENNHFVLEHGKEFSKIE
jgi:hypothetical protein